MNTPKHYKEEDFVIYYEGDSTTQLLPNGIKHPNSKTVYTNSLNWHVAVRVSEGVVKFIQPRSWIDSQIENPSYQILSGYEGWLSTENLIKPLEFFNKSILQEICELTKRIKLDPKDTKKQIIDKIRRTAVMVFNEVERKSNPDIWEIGEVVVKDNRLPCVIVEKDNYGAKVAYFLEPLATSCPGHPVTNYWNYTHFDKCEDVETNTLMKIFKKYISKIKDANHSVGCSREFLIIQIEHYGKDIYKKYINSHKKVSQKEKPDTLEVDMRDINDIIESMNDAMTLIKNAVKPFDDKASWICKNLLRSIARIEATIKHGPH